MSRSQKYATMYKPPKIHQTAKTKVGPVARNLSRSEIDLVHLEINKFMNTRKPFLQKGYSLEDMSNDLGYTIHVLSAVINKSENKHFNAYLNQFRIRYCLEYITKTKTQFLKLRHLADACGFSNRNTFASAFEQITSEKPSVYITKLLAKTQQ